MTLSTNSIQQKRAPGMANLARTACMAIALAALFLAPTGCAGSGTAADGPAAAGTAKMDNDQGKIHAASPEESKYLGSDEPIANNTIILFANGLGCPQCASNIDLQIKKRVPGAESVYVDLAEGTATVDIIPGTKRRLSPKQFEDIVGDAGFTLVKMTSR